MNAIIEAARVPPSLRPQSFGLWQIERYHLAGTPWRRSVGFDVITLLRRFTDATIHLTAGEVVMEDSVAELRKHVPIFQRAAGRVLVTGLGLGCVVRGLLAKPEVLHIDVVELDRGILRVVGAEFAGNERVTLHHGDALTIDMPGAWAFAWHDLWTDGPEHLQMLHLRLFDRFADRCGWQGAWHFPGNLARLLPWNERAA